MIELKNVCYSYEDMIALQDISFKIEEGESVALMGANGCGKSTLLKLLNGILSPDKGSYLFENEEITHKNLADTSFSKYFHQRIGFVFQDTDAQLFCQTVYDEIAFGPRQLGLDEAEVKLRVQDCLKLLELTRYENRTPYHLSGGEKRKVAIACILSYNPKVLVLDEPMNGLDPRTQLWLVSFLQRLHRAGKTLIVSTHNLELVQAIAKRTLLFDSSHKIVADQPTEELLANRELLQEVNLIAPLPTTA